MKPLSHRG